VLSVLIVILTQILLNQGYVALRLKSSLQQSYGRHDNLIDRYEIPISQSWQSDWPLWNTHISVITIWLTVMKYPYLSHDNLIDRYEIPISQSWQSDWPLWNTHISNDNGSITIYVDVFSSLPKHSSDLTVYTRNFLPFRSTWVHPPVLWLLIFFSFLCYDIMCLYILSFSVSLDCPLLIDPMFW
jgi:hypothetical protein